MAVWNVLNPNQQTPAGIRAAIAQSYKQLHTAMPVETIRVSAGPVPKAVFTKKDIMVLREDARALMQNITAEEIINQVDRFQNSYFVIRVDGSLSKSLAAATQYTDTNWSWGFIDINKILVAINRTIYGIVNPRTGGLGSLWQVFYNKQRITAAMLNVSPGKSIWFVSYAEYATGVSRYVRQTGGRRQKASKNYRAKLRAGRATKGMYPFDSLIVRVRKALQAYAGLRSFRIRAAEFPWTVGPAPPRKKGHARKIAIQIIFYPQRLGRQKNG